MTLENELASLPALSSAELRTRWRAVTRSPVPQVSRSLLRLALAWELQAARLGGHKRATTRTLDQLALAHSITQRLAT